MLLSALAMMVNSSMGSFSSTMLGYERFKLYGVLAISTQAIVVILGFIVLYEGLGLIGLGGAHLVTAIIATVTVALFVRKRVCRWAIKFNWQSALKVLRAALPLAVTALLMAIYYRADFIMLTIMQSDKSVGFYNSAYALVNGLLLVSTSFSASILPRLSSYFSSDQLKLDRLYSIGFKYMMYLGLAIAFGATFLASPLYKLIYPDSYLPGADALEILIWALALMFINGLQSAHLIARNFKSRLMLITGGGAILNILLNLILIPKYDFVGASIATVISELMTGIGFFMIIRKHLTFGTITGWVLRIIPGLAVMGLILYFTSGMNVISRAAISGLVLVIMLYVTKGINRDDIGHFIKLLPVSRN